MRSPPFAITAEILGLCSNISRALGKLDGVGGPRPQPHLRRSNRIRTIHGTLAIEGNTLTLEQVTAVLDGHPVIGPAKDILEVHNANRVYARLHRYDPLSAKALLQAHATMMDGLLDDAGRWRTGDVGVLRGTRVAHIAPPAHRVPDLMEDLFRFIAHDDGLHWLLKSAVFHYELEFIHPFTDGNGRVGRLWQQVICAANDATFEFLPIESLVRDHQEDYYRILSESDHAGESTGFVQFVLELLDRALAQFTEAMRPAAQTPGTRIDRALAFFGTEEFTRKDYLQLFKTISSATASRDLRLAVNRGVISRMGDKATSRYKRTKDS